MKVHVKFLTLWIAQWKRYFYCTCFQITVIKKDIVLASRTLDPPFIHFWIEKINQSDLQNYTCKGPCYNKLIQGGGYSNLSWVRLAAQSFNHYPITKPEQTKICNLCLNHFLKGPFFKTNQYLLPCCKLGCIGTFWQPIGKPEDKFIEI